METVWDKIRHNEKQEMDAFLSDGIDYRLMMDERLFLSGYSDHLVNQMIKNFIYSPVDKKSR